MTTEPRTDAELLRAVAGAESGALQVLYERHAGWLSIRLRRRCNDPDVVGASQLLGIPRNAVKTRMHRARIQLRRKLAGGWS